MKTAARTLAASALGAALVTPTFADSSLTTGQCVIEHAAELDANAVGSAFGSVEEDLGELDLSSFLALVDFAYLCDGSMDASGIDWADMLAAGSSEIPIDSGMV